jgi:hypothetical protein
MLRSFIIATALCASTAALAAPLIKPSSESSRQSGPTLVAKKYQPCTVRSACGPLPCYIEAAYIRAALSDARVPNFIKWNADREKRSQSYPARPERHAACNQEQARI